MGHIHCLGPARRAVAAATPTTRFGPPPWRIQSAIGGADSEAPSAARPRVATPRLAVTCAVTVGTVIASKLARIVSAAWSASAWSVSCRRTTNSCRPNGRRSRWRARPAQRRAEGIEHFVAGLVTVLVLSALKWSRSMTMAESGEHVRVDWATMRISASCTERALGRWVSGWVAARCSAIARLRRLARIGRPAPLRRDAVALGRVDAAVLDQEQGADDLAGDELGHAEEPPSRRSTFGGGSGVPQGGAGGLLRNNRHEPSDTRPKPSSRALTPPHGSVTGRC